MIEVIEPNLHLALLVDPNLVLIDTEEAHCVGQLRVSIDARVVEVENVRIRNIFDV